ncbi:MAG: AraC family transcriptional regulator [Dehalococcoidales bacterium]|jgi:AraC family transcriptional regulator
MEWPERMNAAVDYVEANLAGDIDIEKAARIACCSSFHFRRMFYAFAGVTAAEYVRQRRMTLAAKELSTEKTKVIDAAVKYGYDSPDAFTRAFRNVHGITPMAARGPGVMLAAYPRISFITNIKGGNIMDYSIIEKPAFDIVAKARKFTTLQGENFIKIPQFWDEMMQSENGFKALMKLTQDKTGAVTGAGSLGICMMDEVNDKFTYAIGVEKPAAKAAPAGFEVIHIPTATWAVFESIGPMPKAIQTVTVKIFKEWFPSTGYEHAAIPELEVYLPGNPDNQDYHCQVWIPIIKKRK